jgi:hypothetical protein
LYLALLLVLTFLVLMALLWGGTRLLQAALYEQVEPDLYWRAPAAAGALTAFIGLWALFNYMAADPGQTDLPFDTIFNFTTERMAERPVSGFTAVRGGTKEAYTFHDVPGSPKAEYRGPDNKLWVGPREKGVDALVVKEGDKEVTFKADPANGRYVEEGGRRYLDAESFGKIVTPRGGGSFLRVLLNVLHFAVWFVCLWLLLRFQWPHALVGAAALWLTMTFVAPFILKKGVEAKGPKPTATQTANPT